MLYLLNDSKHQPILSSCPRTFYQRRFNLICPNSPSKYQNTLNILLIRNWFLPRSAWNLIEKQHCFFQQQLHFLEYEFINAYLFSYCRKLHQQYGHCGWNEMWKGIPKKVFTATVHNPAHNSKSSLNKSTQVLYQHMIHFWNLEKFVS